MNWARPNEHRHPITGKHFSTAGGKHDRLALHSEVPSEPSRERDSQSSVLGFRFRFYRRGADPMGDAMSDVSTLFPQISRPPSWPTYKISAVKDLQKMSSEKLEEQANILLYGVPLVLEEACQRQIFRRWLYVPRNIKTALIKVEPKTFRLTRERLFCEDCGWPRSRLSGKLCRFCYIKNARLKYFELRENVSDWESRFYGGRDEYGGHTGITMPTTEWWDDSDIPAVPKRLAKVDWNDRMYWK